MLKNIGSYMVKNVEVYDKAGFRSEIAGTDIGDGRYVMDVKLKREYMMGINMNTEIPVMAPTTAISGAYSPWASHLRLRFRPISTPTT